MRVIDPRALREQRERQIAELEARISQREHTVRATERYIRLWGRCLSSAKLDKLHAHAVDVHRSIFKMQEDLEHLKFKPLY